MKIDTVDILVIAFSTALGALLGNWLFGLVIGLGILVFCAVVSIVLVATEQKRHST
jgi:tetrahydromethanopterin S-methyltransferase subunit B